MTMKSHYAISIAGSVNGSMYTFHRNLEYIMQV